MSKKLTFEEIKKYIEKNSECELLSTEYENARTKLRFKCKCGKEFERTFDNFKRKKTTLCQSCSNIRSMSTCAKKKISEAKQKSIENVINLVENQMKCKYIKRYTKKNTRSTIVVFECPEHGIQEVYWTNLAKRKCCPGCNPYNLHVSKMMTKVEKWLNENKVPFHREYKFNGCKDKRTLPFDFYLPTKNICIETDGYQHYGEVFFGNTNSKKGFEYIKKHDEIKNNFCKKNNIKLIRIPYFKENQIDYILERALL